MVVSRIPVQVSLCIAWLNKHHVLATIEEAVEVLETILVQHRARTTTAEPMIDLSETTMAIFVECRTVDRFGQVVLLPHSTWHSRNTVKITSELVPFVLALVLAQEIPECLGPHGQISIFFPSSTSTSASP